MEEMARDHRIMRHHRKTGHLRFEIHEPKGFVEAR